MGRATGARSWWLVVTVLLVADITASFESMMVFAAMPQLIALHKSAADVSWLATGYYIVVAAAAALLGRLGDLYGRKRLLMVALATATMGSLLSYATENLAIMIAGRCVQGLAGAILPLSIGITRDVVPGRKVPLAVGILFSGSVIGALAGVIVGGVIVDTGVWHNIFIVSAALAAGSWLLAAVFIPAIPGKGTGKVDLPGALLFAPAIAAELYGFTRIGHTDPAVPLALIVGGVALLAIWVRHELRQEHPMVDVRALTRREIAVANICVAVGSIGPLQATPVLLMYLQQPTWTGVGAGASATVAGFAKVPVSVISTVGSILAGWLTGRFGARAVVVWGFALSTAGWLAFATWQLGFWPYVMVMGLAGMLGYTMAYVGVTNAVVAASPAGQTSEATGVLAVTRGICTAIGSQLVLPLLGAWTSADPGHGARFYPTPFAYLVTHLAIAVLCAVGMIIGLLLPAALAREARKPAPA